MQLSRRFRACFFVAVLLPSFMSADSYVQARLWGRLGNHFFIIAAATSLALDNGAEASFPDFIYAWQADPKLESNYNLANLLVNYEKIFSHLNVSPPSEEPAFIYKEPSFNYTPIPYQPNMLLEGWFQSEKYFVKHKQAILQLFEPSEEIVRYLEATYSDIIHHPKAVAVHLRSYHKENPALDKVYPTYGREYVEKAMSLFNEDERFIIFSDQVEWAKEELAGIPREMVFIENEEHYHDIYLMSMCKHQIISNSSFSWWAAYLNKNPNKRVVTPPQWFCSEYNHNEEDLIPPEWIVLK